MNTSQEILDDYYLALENIDRHHKQLLKVREDLMWHRDQLAQADELARRLDFSDLSNLKFTQKASYTDVNKNRVSSALSKAESFIQRRQSLQKELESQQQASSQALTRSMDNLNKDLLTAESKLKENDKQIEQLRTTRMIHILLITVVAILSSYFTRNLSWTVSITGIITAVLLFL